MYFFVYIDKIYYLIKICENIYISNYGRTDVNGFYNQRYK